MTENSDSNSFWTDARPADRGWMARGRANVNAYYEAHQPTPEPEPVTSEADAIAGLDLAAYAQHRDELIGVRPSSELVGLDGRHVRDASGFPSVADTAFNSAAEQMAAANSYRRHERPGNAPRERGIPADMVESQGGIAARGYTNPTR